MEGRAEGGDGGMGWGKGGGLTRSPFKLAVGGVYYMFYLWGVGDGGDIRPPASTVSEGVNCETHKWNSLEAFWGPTAAWKLK